MTPLKTSSLEYAASARPKLYPGQNETHKKNRSLGCPSSESRKLGFVNELNNETKRFDEVTDKCLKYGAEFDNAMISAG